MFKSITFKTTVRSEYSNTTTASDLRLSNTDGGCTSLLTQFECVHEISIDANPELAELAELLDRGVLVPPPSKPVQPKLLLYDVLMTIILLFLFVLVGLDIWSHFVVVHGA
ncbi:hypothetical protein EDD15DRAFT_2193896 [Pisolithus albus]|nr:hypothetical protein EDD15DRAFT_2193896 [Pisolithus albus]